jgi:hypothetical protein
MSTERPGAIELYFFAGQELLSMRFAHQRVRDQFMIAQRFNC